MIDSEVYWGNGHVIVPPAAGGVLVRGLGRWRSYSPEVSWAERIVVLRGATSRVVSAYPDFVDNRGIHLPASSRTISFVVIALRLQLRCPQLRETIPIASI